LRNVHIRCTRLYCTWDSLQKYVASDTQSRETCCVYVRDTSSVCMFWTSRYPLDDGVMMLIVLADHYFYKIQSNSWISFFSYKSYSNNNNESSSVPHFMLHPFRRSLIGPRNIINVNMPACAKHSRQYLGRLLRQQVFSTHPLLLMKDIYQIRMQNFSLQLALFIKVIQHYSCTTSFLNWWKKNI